MNHEKTDRLVEAFEFLAGAGRDQVFECGIRELTQLVDRVAGPTKPSRRGGIDVCLGGRIVKLEPGDARFVLKGALTRLALYFAGRGSENFTGEEVAGILLGAWQSFEDSQEPLLLALSDATGYVEPDAHLGAVENG